MEIKLKLIRRAKIILKIFIRINILFDDQAYAYVCRDFENIRISLTHTHAIGH